MSLRKKQSMFVEMIALLIMYARERGYEFTFGDAYRDPRVFGEVGESTGYGRSRSLHKQRLAIDLNLFVDGVYITGDHPAYQDLGDFWKKLGGSWGGDFQDYNHFSLLHQGMR